MIPLYRWSNNAAKDELTELLMGKVGEDDSGPGGIIDLKQVARSGARRRLMRGGELPT